MGLLDILKQMAEENGLFEDDSYQAQHTASKPDAAQSKSSQTSRQSDSSTSSIYSPQIEGLINMALADGELTEKERQVLYRKAESEGIDLDEFEMVLEARFYQRTQQQKQQQQQQQQQSAAHSQASASTNKYGEAKKCPACGAFVQSFTTHCPQCGLEFRNVQANGSIQRLFEMLNEVECHSKEDSTTFLEALGRSYGEEIARCFGGTKSTRMKKAIIQNFPIPNTKEDILEFLALAAPLAKKPGFFNQDMERRDMYPVWKSKCEQVIMKARFSMKNDKETLAEIMSYAKEIGIK